MKKFDSKPKNFFYFFYRILSPIIDPVKTILGLLGFTWFFRDYVKFYTTSKIKPKIKDFFPQLHDKTELTPFDAHYFFQQIWVFENVLETKPKRHVDVASTYELSGYLSKIVKTLFIDYRPIKTNLKNLEIKKGDINDLPLKDGSVESLSCLHVIEHIGLGRYGDEIDAEGYRKAIKELQRVLAKGGNLYFSTPIGKEAVYFNAHRVFNPQTIVDEFDGLKLISFNVVDDEGEYKENVNYKKYNKLNYGCGMFHFKK